MLYMRDPEGNIHNLNYIQALVKHSAQGWTELSPHEASEYERKFRQKNTLRTKPTPAQSTEQFQQPAESLLTDFVYQSAVVESDCQSSETRSRDTSSSCHDNSSHHSSSYDSHSSGHDYSGGHDYSSGGDSW